MSYNNSLNLNNSNLQEIIQSLESLPNAINYQEKSVMPSIGKQIVTCDDGYDCLSRVTVYGDEDLTSENIKKGINLFGIYGTYLNPDNGTLSAYSNEEDAIITGSLSGVYVNDRVTSIGNAVFTSCTNLTSVNFPNVISIGNFAFEECTNLTSMSFPNVTYIGGNAFQSCTSLTSISFPKTISISNYALRYCYRLSSLTLGANTVCTLSGSNAFTSTPFAGYRSYFSGTPHIYVPASLVSAYQSATNWVYFSNYFVGV